MSAPGRVSRLECCALNRATWGITSRLGVLESRLDFGSGYRIYFGIDKGDLVFLLLGGTKRSQQRDIRQAQQYWAEYLKGK